MYVQFSVGYRAFNTSNIIDIHKYLTKKTWYKIMFGLNKKNIYAIIS